MPRSLVVTHPPWSVRWAQELSAICGDAPSGGHGKCGDMPQDACHICGHTDIECGTAQRACQAMCPCGTVEAMKSCVWDYCETGELN